MDKNKNDQSHDEKQEMKTLSACVNRLTQAGFEVQFKMHKSGLQSLSSEKIYKPEDIKIVSFYRFEGESDPADNSILYAIETSTGEKGTLTDAYGVYADTGLSEFMKEVEAIHKKPHDKDDSMMTEKDGD